MEKLKISTSVGLFRVPTEDIAYIEASGNYCDVHLFNGEVVTMTFQLHYFVEALNNLKQNFFTRVGKSLIVNKNFGLSAKKRPKVGAKFHYLPKRDLK